MWVAMRLDRRELPLADGRVRYVTTLVDDDAPTQRDVRRLMFLQTLIDSPSLLGAYDAMRVWYDGARWSAETEIVQRKVAP